jgi:hypothetical protein
MLDSFPLIVEHNRRRLLFRVFQKPSDKSFDYYEVVARNKSILFRNNAPVLRRHNLKRRRPTWEVVSGDIWNVAFKEKIIKALDLAINGTDS